MPFSGNPHPMPSHLQPNENLFVGPQFPEIGWDAIHDQGHNNEGGDNLDEGAEVDAAPDAEDQVSMVLKPSNNSVLLVNIMHNQLQL